MTQMLFHNAKHGNWWGVLDTIGHWLHLPKRIQNPICDRYDDSLDPYGWPPTSSSATFSHVKVSLRRRPR